ncbi:TPR and ankyrin repeat-containing protein 1-like isoform X1 [Ptychodera flava]|uniref:TPR and ankyrin repeat-containing protein 1-like isoform X1 n=1 Tax=Ptychodera flava TaxID=63121 RepID=UPI003969FFCA
MSSTRLIGLRNFDSSAVAYELQDDGKSVRRVDAEDLKRTHGLDLKDLQGPAESPPKQSQDGMKYLGNKYMKEGNYQKAMEMYTVALRLQPSCNNTEREHAILYSNRSQAYLKLQQYPNAVDDALRSIRKDRTWWKGYFRAGLAFQREGKYYDALEVLVDGLEFVKVSGFDARITTVDYLMEIARVMTKAPSYSPAYDRCSASNDIWSVVTLKLAKRNEWDAIYKLFLGGGNGKPPGSGGVANGCNTSIVSIEDLCRTRGATKWGIKLAFELIKHGSDPDGLMAINNEPPCHCALRYCLLSGNFEFLEYLLKDSKIGNRDKNQLNSSGESLYHIAVFNLSDRKTSAKIFHTALDILAYHRANPLCKDYTGKFAVDYLKSPALKKKLSKIMKDYKTPKPSSSVLRDPKSTYEEGCGMMEKGQWYDALKTFCSFVEEHHNSKTTDPVKIDESKNHIIQILTHMKEVPANVECKIEPSMWTESMKAAAEKGLWKEIYLMLNGGGNGSSIGDGGLAKDSDMSGVSIQDCLSSGHTERYIKKYDIVKALLENGANPNGFNDNSVKPLHYAIKELEDSQLAQLLLKHGADPSFLSLEDGDTPLHAALTLTFQKKDNAFEILKILLETHKQDPSSHPNLDPCIQDKGGNTLFHLVIQGKCNHMNLTAVKLLREYRVDPQIKNKQGKIPLNSLKKDDRRLPYLQMAAQYHQNTRSKGSQSRQSKEAQTRCMDDEAVRDDSEKSADSRASKEEIKRLVAVKIEEIPEFVVKRARFDTGVEKKTRKTEPTTTVEKAGSGKTAKSAENSVNKEPAEIDEKDLVTMDIDDNEGTEEMDELDPSLFDDLVWEVECTSAVWKILRDKRLEQGMKVRIINKIRLLASGIWRPDLAKRLEGTAKQRDILLFESKLTKAARILWELAIAFSPRCSEDPERRLQIADFQDSEDSTGTVGGRIYSEVIRVWDIVFDHDNVSRSIDNIVKSHQRGQECIIRKNLKGINRKEFSKGRTAMERVPMFFREINHNKQKVTEEPKSKLLKKKMTPEDAAKLFFPPASSNETEYHIMKFYSFSSTLVNSILLNEDIKVDFPFRVTELEHAIINLQPDPPSAILLLGRSGTGKTTCCLYRLWTSFIRYWEHAVQAGEPLIPRDMTFVHENGQDDKNDDVHSNFEDGEVDCRDDKAGAAGSSLSIYESLNDDVSCNVNPSLEDAVMLPGEIAMDHLHQIFVTKNAVLCSEVEKNFRDLSHAHDAAKEHVAVEDNSLPYRLQDAHPAQYPMFLTSRQWLLMMDATLPEPYFPRKPDGSLKREVKGWGTDDGPLSFIQLLDESDDEDEDDDDDEDEETLDITVKDEQGRQRKEIDPRKEVTYEVFAYELWSKINKNKVDYHPTLVWMEIKSFIQGSIEALHTVNGHLSLEQYEELGRKRAPNFTADRREIYKLFEKYKGTKRQRGLFDESDLVFSVYHRLKKVESPDWCIHQFYVDETQDFTQAELSLLIRCCSNPNALFLTGDTAQSIMRGVAFRFDDLKTLFHYASKSMKAVGKTSSVTVPKRVYQLTHNYRSHAGILDLATSVVDLMIEFFPESFDRLQRDQGLFDGPQPVLLESCSFSDLALLLRGNKRKTSEIEFGAHQVILVANEEAKAALPKELSLGLVLTIYESKGLEFDDVLLYNFFKDSPAQKEWRVVTTYLQQLTENFKDGLARSSEKNCVEIDLVDDHEQINAPRPLQFDPDKHKVLNSELKYLYTAVTRARVNVWIFDEDREKRAPMFEYFRKRRLVQVVRIKDNESGQEGLSDGMFATPSTPEEWNKRGDYFYNNKLWKVAAKCYVKGMDKRKAKMSLAHDKAMAAEQLRENPRKLRAKFLAAADEFLQCEAYQPAARCLYNAKEYHLSANLFEKIGKFTNAALLHEKRLKNPLDAARCYEKTANYRKAVELLCSVQAFDKASDVVERYNIKKREYEEKMLPLPEELSRNPPGVLDTLERLSFRAADMHYHARNFDKMKTAISQFPKLEDQLQFLKDRNRMEDAADLLKENGRQFEAAKLLRSMGKLMDALELADAKDDVSFRAEVLLACGRVHVLRYTGDQSEVLEYLAEASSLFKEVENPVGEAEAMMLTAALTKDQGNLAAAYDQFFKENNIPGQVECVKNIINNWPLTIQLMQDFVLHTLEQLFKLVSVIYKPMAVHEKHVASLCDHFYGLKEVGPNKREVLIHEGACFLRFDQHHSQLSSHSSSKQSNIKTTSKVVEVATARSSIVKHLLSLASHWIKLMKAVLKEERMSYSQCPDYVIGVPCTNKGECPHLHEPYKKFTYFNYLQAITTEIMLTDVLLGTRKLSCFKDIQREMDFWHTKEIDVKDIAERLCSQLHDALLPKHCHLRISSEKSAAMLDVLKILKRFPVVDCIRDVAERKWAASNKIDKCSNTDLYFLIWIFHLLSQTDSSVFKNWIIDVEKSYWNEVMNVRKVQHPEKIPSHIGLMAVQERKVINFFSIFHPFLQSAAYLHEGNDPVQSVGSFNRFIGLPAKRAVPPLIPSICNVVMMLELKYTLAMTIFAKCRSAVVIVPASYLAQVTFFDMLCAPKKGRPALHVCCSSHGKSR